MHMINKVAKSLNKIVAKQIQECIKKIIHHNQVLFVPEIQSRFNTCTTTNIIESYK